MSDYGAMPKLQTYRLNDRDNYTTGFKKIDEGWE